MNSAEVAAFTGASGTAPSLLLFVIAASVMVALMTWTCWVAYGQFRSWQQSDISAYDFIWTLLRASIVLLVAGWFIR